MCASAARTAAIRWRCAASSSGAIRWSATRIAVVVAQRIDADVHQAGQPAPVVLDRHAQAVGDPLLARGLADVLQPADRVRDLARDLADAARQQVAAAQTLGGGVAAPTAASLRADREALELPRVGRAGALADQPASLEHAEPRDARHLVAARQLVECVGVDLEHDRAAGQVVGRLLDLGAAAWHGPHHAAQKSTRTGTRAPALISSTAPRTLRPIGAACDGKAVRTCRTCRRQRGGGLGSG